MLDTTSPAVDNAAPSYITFRSEQVNADWVLSVTEKLLASTQGGLKAAQEVLPHAVAQQILEALYNLLKQEPTVVDVAPAAPDIPVVVVGDTHGQLHDVCSMLQKIGYPSERQLLVFNGDFVDRGAWGLEVLILLACWKLAYPKHVTILRGNHECTTCTHMYGFRTEVLSKYGPKNFKDVFKVCKKVFAALPLAAVVGGQTLILHGGLFRKPMQSTHRRKKRRKTLPGNALEIGSLQDLRAAGKGGLDPNGAGKSVIATDVLWSDPAPEPGLVENLARGVGLLFGPDVTKAFLEANKLKLIIRSHEGPDARWKREGMQDMAKGHSLDHITPEGKLVTVFSAPDYPQFQPSQEDRFNNLGAVAVLRGSHDNYASPEMIEYPAAPRPQAQAFYNYEDVPDSDEEMSIGHGSASDMSAASSQAGSLASHASAAAEEHTEVISKAPGRDGDSPKQPSSGNSTLHTAADASDAADGEAEATDNGHGADMLHMNSAANVIAAPQLSDSAAVQSLDAATWQHQEPGINPHSEADPVGQLPNRQKDTDSAGSPIHAVAANASAAVEPGQGKDVSQRKRKAATVFDQGVAAQAEAADLNAGIAAQGVDHEKPALECTGEVEVTNELTDANTDAFAAVTHAADTAPDSILPFKPTRKALPRPAPWR
ncbi:hypothetical protein WJX77_000861 [Trebouxia sp. C0004]